MYLDTEYFSQRIQCSRDDMHESLRTIFLLAEIGFTYLRGSIRAVDNLIKDNSVKYSELFLNRALQLFIDAKHVEQIRTVLYNTIITSNFFGKQFLNAVLITECLASLYEKEDMDYIFTFLIPSYFGMEYEENARLAYKEFRQAKLNSLQQGNN